MRRTSSTWTTTPMERTPSWLSFPILVMTWRCVFFFLLDLDLGLFSLVLLTHLAFQDAMIINKQSYERGFQHGTVYKTEIIDLMGKDLRIRAAKKCVILLSLSLSLFLCILSLRSLSLIFPLYLSISLVLLLTLLPLLKGSLAMQRRARSCAPPLTATASRWSASSSTRPTPSTPTLMRLASTLS